MCEKERPRELPIILERDLYPELQKIFGIDFVSGLPCGELKGFIESSQAGIEMNHHLQATNENEAVAISQGAYLAGRKPVLYMQNSGFLKSVNEIGSLLLPCKTPTLFVVSWRGAPGENATQHLATGAATIPIIEALGLPYIIDPTEEKLIELRNRMYSLGVPGLILMKKERLNSEVVPNTRAHSPEPTLGDLFKEPASELFLSREEAIEILFSSLISSNDAVFSSTGLISRSIYHHHDSANQFYNAGAFGFTSSIALGFAANNRVRRSIVIEGDGSVLTNLGSLNIISHQSPDNFIHVVLDNAAYASCSAEKTYGSEKISEIAHTFGYSGVFTVQSPEFIQGAIEMINSNSFKSPVMLHILINSEGQRDFKRPLEMSAISKRFKTHFDVSER